MVKNALNYSLDSKRLAELISTVSNPAIVFLVALAIITGHYAQSSSQYWRWLAIGTLLIIVPGLLYSSFTWYREKRIDIDITRRQDRFVPLLLASAGAVTGAYLINTRLNSSRLDLLADTLISTLVLLTIITFVWKISLHAATLTAVASLVIIFRGPEFLWLYLLFLPVAWARLVLKQHTIAQLSAGFIAGLVITYGSALIFR